MNRRDKGLIKCAELMMLLGGVDRNAPGYAVQIGVLIEKFKDYARNSGKQGDAPCFEILSGFTTEQLESYIKLESLNGLDAMVQFVNVDMPDKKKDLALAVIATCAAQVSDAMDEIANRKSPV